MQPPCTDIRLVLTPFKIGSLFLSRVNLVRLLRLFKPCYLQLELLVKLHPISTLRFNLLPKLLKGHV